VLVERQNAIELQPLGEREQRQIGEVRSSAFNSVTSGRFQRAALALRRARTRFRARL
jgi:hypothetical protein